MATFLPLLVVLLAVLHTARGYRLARSAPLADGSGWACACTSTDGKSYAWETPQVNVMALCCKPPIVDTFSSSCITVPQYTNNSLANSTGVVWASCPIKTMVLSGGCCCQNLSERVTCKPWPFVISNP